ncbi:TPA: hypothetical protein I0H46_RS10940 [Enterococcus faecalis]|uniref:hypothetical protein n=1 Tax=Enterococcus faecalis TaxID=1351 RepID=UPI0005342BA1|nr:hypothetical protein [Enterococcus faecalis]HBI2014345.1 hypothetical protein [Enterococcus faecalis]
MSKKAVWLSDIEFIEMHSSDWERLESEAFEADESVQAQFKENQHVVLDWLKEKYTVTNIEPIELFWRLRVNSIKPYYRGRPVYRSYRYMSKIGQLQVLQAFSQWAIEQEEAE